MDDVRTNNEFLDGSCDPKMLFLWDSSVDNAEYKFILMLSHVISKIE